MRFTYSIAISTGLLLFAGQSPAQTTCVPSLPADVCALELKIYTATNFKNTAEVRDVLLGLKQLMMDHSKDSRLVQDHILDMARQTIEEAYDRRAPKKILAKADGQNHLLKMLPDLRKWEAKHGQIVPLDWKLPTDLAIAVSNFERSYEVATDRTRYQVSFFIPHLADLVVEQLKVSKYGGPALIDKAAGIGFIHGGVSPQDKQPYTSAGSANQETPLEPGLYLFSIKLKGQNQVDGWYFLTGTPNATPAIYTPQVKEKFRTPFPTFGFEDFRSNVMLSSDHRKRSVYAIDSTGARTNWKTSVVNPKDNSTVTVGKCLNESGPSELIPGSYRLRVIFEERSYFGDLVVGRLASTNVSFQVTK